MKKYSSVFKALLFSNLIYITGLIVYINCKFDLLNMIYSNVFIILTIVTMGICVWFNKSRVFFCILEVFTGLFGITYITERINSIEISKELAVFISIFIPINLLIFAMVKERGIISLFGIMKFGMIFIQAFFFFWWVKVQNESFYKIFSFKLLPSNNSFFEFFPQLAIVLTIVIFIIMIVLSIYRRSTMDLYFAAVIPAFVLAIGFSQYKSLSAVFSIIIVVILLISIFHESYNMAFLDELTTLPGRRALKHELMKVSGKYTVAMLDIDFFKKFNDTYGHDVGDQVLKMVASVMKEVTGGGKPFRYGGEEFTIVFPGKGMNEAIPHLEELRESIGARGFIQREKNNRKSNSKARKKTSTGKKLFVTVSIGVCERNDKYKKPDEVMKAADNALYRAKKKGRNCVSK